MIELRYNDEDCLEAVMFNGKQVQILDDEDAVLVECSLNDVVGIFFKDIPANLSIRVQDTEGFNTGLFYELEITVDGIEFTCDFPNKYWEGKWGLSTFLSEIKKQAESLYGHISADCNIEDTWKEVALHFRSAPFELVEEVIDLAIKDLNNIIRSAEISLGGVCWKKDYETNEALFCEEILTPLLRKMSFKSVRYNHGKKEFGKDFTFSELTPFGHLRHYGLQAKAGNIGGGVNSAIDEIIGQVNDAFDMKYIDMDSRETKYISTLVIAISGKFTENAKEKIVDKIRPGLIGSIIFLDKEKILELIHQYWIK